MAIRCAQVGIVAALLLSACGGQDAIGISVGEEKFTVPREHVLPSRVDWLPEFGEFDGFVFTARPTAPLGEQFAVTVESRTARCAPDNVASSELVAFACTETTGTSTDVSELQRDLVYPDVESFWNYTVQTGDGSRRLPIASCYAAESIESGGICSALGQYSSLIYSFSFKDGDMGSMDERRAEIEALLGAWDVK